MAKDASEEEDEVDQTGVSAEYRWDLHTHSVLTLSQVSISPPHRRRLLFTVTHHVK